MGDGREQGGAAYSLTHTEAEFTFSWIQIDDEEFSVPATDRSEMVTVKFGRNGMIAAKDASEAPRHKCLGDTMFTDIADCTAARIQWE